MKMFARLRATRIAALPLAFLLACGLSDVDPRDIPPPDADVGPKNSAASNRGSTVSVHVIGEDGQLVGPRPSPKVSKPDSAWQAQLSPERFHVTRKAGTERPFTGSLLRNKSEGVYTCACCGLPLFASKSKFKSGTGWPSFYEPIAKSNVGEHRDSSLGMVRVEIVCNRCDAHLGHVFRDGPRPTGLRYCVNSLSLAFTKKEDLSKIAESLPAKTYPERAEVVLAGGCFWCVEAVFEELDGVIDAVSGYAGGDAETANYTAVCSGRTGHAEVVKVIYDPSRISYAELLRVHFATHDPTTLNRQGADRGTQYRSAIFFANAEEKAIAGAYINKLNESGVFPDPVVTTLEPLETFFEAEPKHQNFVCENPNQGYVRAVALPKVAKVRKAFPDKLKKKENSEDR
jgi:peptide methionine sulfoxide reductase msrA/msrB